MSHLWNESGEGPAKGKDQSILLNESEIDLASIKTQVVRRGSLNEDIILTGKLSTSQKETEVITSRVQGRIEKLFYKESGQSVLAGQPLYEIYSEQLLTLEQEYLIALAQPENGGRPFVAAARRKLELLGLSLDQITWLSKQKQAAAQLTFFAPTGGVIVDIETSEGRYVAEGSPLFKIEKLDQLWLDAQLYPGETSVVTRGDLVDVVVSGYEDAPKKGKVIIVNPEYKPGSQTVTVRIAIDNHDGRFLPGAQATVTLLHSSRSCLTLPADAVLHTATGSQVWIQDKDGSFYGRSVTTGKETVDRVEITNGLQEGERVVVTGAYLLYGELSLKKG